MTVSRLVDKDGIKYTSNLELKLIPSIAMYGGVQQYRVLLSGSEVYILICVSRSWPTRYTSRPSWYQFFYPTIYHTHHAMMLLNIMILGSEIASTVITKINEKITEQVNHFRFRARKTKLSTLSSFKELLWSDTICPAQLNTHSDGTLVAQRQRYLCASLASRGYWKCSTFHHSSGESSTSSWGLVRYWSSSCWFSPEGSGQLLM